MNRMFEKTGLIRTGLIRTGVAAIVAAGLLSTTAAQARPGHGHHSAEAAAIEACADHNLYGPVMLVEAVEDGLGDMLVWLEDRDGDLWLCNADPDGNVYLNVLIDGDLLEGEGYELVSWGANQPSFGQRPNPRFAAERLCTAVLEEYFDLTSIWATTVADGLGDYLVWLEADEGSLWACNTSADNTLYVFERVDAPIDHFDGGPMA